MNKDQVKGAAKSAVGSAQRRAGKLIGSARLQAKGIGKQVAGEVQQAFGDAREAGKNLRSTRATKRRA